MWKWLQRIGIVLGFIGLSWGLMQLSPDQDYLRQQQFKTLFKAVMPQVQAAHPNASFQAQTLYWPDHLQSPLKSQLAQWHKDNAAEPNQLKPVQNKALPLQFKWSNSRWNDQLTVVAPEKAYTVERLKVR